MCAKKGMCLATNSGSRRKRDCPFAGKCNSRWVTDADRAEVIKYLLAEDAEAAPKPEGKPTEDKQEPIKLYCVKDLKAGKWLAKGKVYGTDEHGRFVYEDGSTTADTFANAKDVMRSAIGQFLVPLVKRPAKVGEWVYITKSCEERASKGKIYEVAPYGMDSCLFIKHPKGLRSTDGSANIRDSEYLVLDGYHPEPEKEPEPKFYNGKVVCVSSGDECFTVGKMYEFVNGEVKDDEGDKRPMFADRRFKSVDEWNEAYGSPLVQFIEFKGESHD